MKQTLLILMALALLFALQACGAGDDLNDEAGCETLATIETACLNTDDGGRGAAFIDKVTAACEEVTPLAECLSCIMEQPCTPGDGEDVPLVTPLDACVTLELCPAIDYYE